MDMTLHYEDDIVILRSTTPSEDTKRPGECGVWAVTSWVHIGLGCGRHEKILTEKSHGVVNSRHMRMGFSYE